MHVSLMFPNEYLCAADLQQKDVTLTISELKEEELKTTVGTETKWVMYFQETDARFSSGKSRFQKRLVINKTNARSIWKATGETNTDEWIGKTITLYATQCEAFGEMVDCIRIRE